MSVFKQAVGTGLRASSKQAIKAGVKVAASPQLRAAAKGGLKQALKIARNPRNISAAKAGVAQLVGKQATDDLFRAAAKVFKTQLGTAKFTSKHVDDVARAAQLGMKHGPRVVKLMATIQRHYKLAIAGAATLTAILAAAIITPIALVIDMKLSDEEIKDLEEGLQKEMDAADIDTFNKAAENDAKTVAEIQAELDELKANQEGKKDFMSRFWWIFPLVGVIVLILIIVLVVILSKKKSIQPADPFAISF